MILYGYVLTAKLAIMTNAGKSLAILMVMLMPWV